MNLQKIVNQLIENKMYDYPVLVLCTKWNASFGARVISIFGDDIFITPVSDGIYGANIKKTKKISKDEIKDIGVVESSWKGSKIIIELNDGEKLSYKLVNSSWLEPARTLCLLADKAVKVTKKTMTVEEAFILDCRVTAKQMNLVRDTFTLSELVHKVVNNDNDAEEWIRIRGEKIYLALKEDIKAGQWKAKIILPKKDGQIIYKNIKFVKLS